MASEQLLVRSLIALGVIFALCVLFLLGHGAWLGATRRRVQRQLARGRAALTGLVTADLITDEERREVAALSAPVRARLFVELSRTFGGAVSARLLEVAEATGTVRVAERMLRSRRWWTRLRGLRVLTALGASERTILKHLYDPHPAVRAQVAEWTGDHPTPAALRALLDSLGQADPLYRFTLQDALLRAGQAAVEPLAQYLHAHDGAQVLPALEVAATLAHPALTGPALALSHDSQTAVRARAAELLGRVGGEEATARVCALLADPEPAVRAAAAEALGRLGHWPAARAIAPLLRDRAWEVRRAAGLALLALGSPGQLFLERFRGDADRYAADMATQVLDLPVAAEVARR